MADRFLRSEESLNLSIYEKVLLFMIASYSGNKSECFASQPTLAKFCSMSVPSLKRATRSLEDRRLICVKRLSGERNHYKLTIPSSDRTGFSGNPVPIELTTQLSESLLPSSDRATNNISNNITEYTSIVSLKNRQAKKPPKKNKCSFPDDLKITDSHKAKANQLGLDVASEFEHFQEHHIAKGNQFCNWDMAFHTWLRNSAKFSQLNKSIKTERNIMDGVGCE